MANLRVVYDNAVDRVSTLTASTTAGSLVASNLLTDIKSEIWRSTSTTASLTLTWPDAEMVSMVALPFASLTSLATIRVQGYLNAGDSASLFDTGNQFACPSAFGLFEWGNVELGVNAYSYGGGTYAVIWFPVRGVRKLVVTLTDTTNPNGYIEAARIVAGNYWEPTNNCEYGVTVTAADMSKHERSDAGDLRTDRGARYKAISVDLTMMPSADRNSMWRILLGNGMAKPLFFSLTPGNIDSTEEQIFQLYGKVTRMSAIKYQFLNQYNSNLDLEEI